MLVCVCMCMSRHLCVSVKITSYTHSPEAIPSPVGLKIITSPFMPYFSVLIIGLKIMMVFAYPGCVLWV